MSGNMFHDLRYGMGKLLYASPIYRYTLVGRTPAELAAIPPDAWPGNAERGAAISAGELSFLGETVRGGDLTWQPVGMSDAWLAELHGFDWLRDLRAVGGDAARRKARDLVGDWIERQAGWQEIAWRPDVLATRLHAWLSHHDFFCASADDEYRRRYLASIARQAKHLGRVLPGGVEGAGLIRAAKGLVAAGVALEGSDASVRQGLRQLDRATERQIRPDGGHISRDPQTQAAVLRDLVDVRSALLAASEDIPSFLLAAIDRASPFLRMLRHNDGGLALFNGSGESEGWLVDMLLAQADARGRAPIRAPHSGFERMVANRTIVLLDTGAPPQAGLDKAAHAGTLSLEISIGKERLVTNCGARPGNRDPWASVQRSTAAHSTMVVDDTNSSEILPDGTFGRRPQSVTAERDEDDGNHWVSASHDGYVPVFGLTHERRVYLAANGDDIRGEDALTRSDAGTAARNARGFALRFHLHPTVQASLVQNGSAVLLRLPSGAGWRLIAEGGTLSLAESVYLGTADDVRRTEQVVVSGTLDADTDAARVKWAVKKVPKKS
ncbi:MAG: heparinase II/III family protein [Alphaproteobacteria bacterium]|nr:heparinase II/III family protein [Alphaproteobacteria bacterium]